MQNLNSHSHTLKDQQGHTAPSISRGYHSTISFWETVVAGNNGIDVNRRYSNEERSEIECSFSYCNFLITTLKSNTALYHFKYTLYSVHITRLLQTAAPATSHCGAMFQFGFNVTTVAIVLL